MSIRIVVLKRQCHEILGMIFSHEEPYVAGYNIFVLIFKEFLNAILEGFFMNKLLLYVVVSEFTVLTV
jgi:hypothetical protein